MFKKIPITIITGFLGAGKTTLINQLLTSKHQQSVAIVINEFGEIGVDHQFVLDIEEQIYQMNNGCLCCSLRSDITDVLLSILEAQEKLEFKLDHIIFETTGLADPGPIAQTFFNVPFLKEHFSIDSVLTVVDMEHILHQLYTREEPRKQIAFADKIIFSKADKVPSIVKRKVLSEITKLNPFVEKINVTFNDIVLEDFIGHKLFDASAKTMLEEETVDSPEHASGHSHHEHHHHLNHEDVSSFAIQEYQALDITKIEQWIQGLIYVYGQNLYRYKGILNIEGLSEQIIFQGINMNFQFCKGKPWGNSARESTLIFIGKDIQQNDITESFYNCLHEQPVEHQDSP